MTTTKIIVLFDNTPIGAMRAFTLTKKYGTSEDGYQWENVKLEGSRMRLDRLKVADVFSRSFINVAAQKYPVQIVVMEDDQEVQKIHNAWFSSIGYSYTSGDWIILESFMIEAEKVT